MNNNWITLWGWIYGVALAGFYVLVLVVIPSGYKDIRRLFRELRKR
jgi:hypothetical protein